MLVDRSLFQRLGKGSLDPRTQTTDRGLIYGPWMATVGCTCNFWKSVGLVYFQKWGVTLVVSQDEGSLGDQQWSSSAGHVQGVGSGRDNYLHDNGRNEVSLSGVPE